MITFILTSLILAVRTKHVLLPTYKLGAEVEGSNEHSKGRVNWPNLIALRTFKNKLRFSPLPPIYKSWTLVDKNTVRRWKAVAISVPPFHHEPFEPSPVVSTKTHSMRIKM